MVEVCYSMYVYVTIVYNCHMLNIILDHPHCTGTMNPPLATAQAAPSGSTLSSLFAPAQVRREGRHIRDAAPKLGWAVWAVKGWGISNHYISPFLLIGEKPASPISGVVFQQCFLCLCDIYHGSWYIWIWKSPPRINLGHFARGRCLFHAHSRIGMRGGCGLVSKPFEHLLCFGHT